jgi:hypothetical protein
MAREQVSTLQKLTTVEWGKDKQLPLMDSKRKKGQWKIFTCSKSDRPIEPPALYIIKQSASKETSKRKLRQLKKYNKEQ